ncbi:hypothetical protein Tco_0946921 [Tanacetum coccineum]
MGMVLYQSPQIHKITNAKEMWDAIKSRFGRNDESKKMQKYILKQKFKGFSVSNSEGLHKGYDRFQNLLSQLEIHRAGVDSLNFDDLYNNLRVFENDVKGSTESSSSTKNVALSREPPTILMMLVPLMVFLILLVITHSVDWTIPSEEEEDYALMACNSSGSDIEREQLSDASIEIQAYTQGLKKVEA